MSPGDEPMHANHATDASRPSSAARGLVRVPVELSDVDRKGVYVVVAAYQEVATVGAVVRELREVFPNVVVVDDGSHDATAESARAAGARVLRHALNRGQGAALQTGIAYALGRGAQIVVTFDADGQHQVADLPYLVEPIVRGSAEVVLGSRFIGEGRKDVPPLRRALLRCAVLFTWLASGLRLSDAHNGLRAFSRSAALQLDIQLDRMAHASELIDQVKRSGLPLTEVPVRIRYTDYSRAKGQRSSDALRVAADYLIGRLLQ